MTMTMEPAQAFGPAPLALGLQLSPAHQTRSARPATGPPQCQLPPNRVPPPVRPESWERRSGRSPRARRRGQREHRAPARARYGQKFGPWTAPAACRSLHSPAIGTEGSVRRLRLDRLRGGGSTTTDLGCILAGRLGHRLVLAYGLVVGSGLALLVPSGHARRHDQHVRERRRRMRVRGAGFSRGPGLRRSRARQQIGHARSRRPSLRRSDETHDRAHVVLGLGVGRDAAVLVTAPAPAL